MRVINQKITDFLSTLNLGLSWIGDAGRKLVAILDESPDAFEDILAETSARWLTREVLQTIEAIGRGQISPDTLLLPLHVLNRLASLPTQEQIRAMQGVAVAVPARNGKGHPTEILKRAKDLTPTEAARVIGPNGIRSIEEQLAAKRDQTFTGSVLGKYSIIVEIGQEPRLQRLCGEHPAGYQKQRVRLVKGCAIIELYL